MKTILIIHPPKLKGAIFKPDKLQFDNKKAM